MLFKTYLISSIIALILFCVAQYQGISWSSERGETSQSAYHHGSGGGSYSSGSHRGTFHK